MAEARYPLLTDANALTRRYIKERHSTNEIAAEVGCSSRTVRKALRAHGIPLRPTGSPQNIFAGERYGRLVVVAQDGRRNGYRAYRCLCDCGTEVVALARDLNA